MKDEEFGECLFDFDNEYGLSPESNGAGGSGSQGGCGGSGGCGGGGGCSGGSGGCHSSVMSEQPLFNEL